LPELESLNALVVGVSADTPEVQRRFIEKFELTFPMVSDKAKRVIDAYSARDVLGIVAKRSTFLVGPDGLIAHVWPRVSVEGHADDVARTIERLSKR
jgi:thioredoxin-dependent peroxiredoxin